MSPSSVTKSDGAVIAIRGDDLPPPNTHGGAPIVGHRGMLHLGPDGAYVHAARAASRGPQEDRMAAAVAALARHTATFETIVTDPARRTAHEIDALR